MGGRNRGSSRRRRFDGLGVRDNPTRHPEYDQLVQDLLGLLWKGRPSLELAESVDWVQSVLGDMGLRNCQVADHGGLTSLMRPDRQHFLMTKYRVGAVPAFSVVAVAQDDDKSTPNTDERTISKILRGPWKSLRAYSLDEDSQVIADEGVVPGGGFLAIARADHWDVALPFQETTNPDDRRRALRAVDRNTYPRTALLEAILRIVNP